MAGEAVKTLGRRRVTYAAWLAEGAALFGSDRRGWWFQCPACGFEQAARETRVAGVSLSMAAMFCFRDQSGEAVEGAAPCACGLDGYAGAGLHPVVIVFEDGSVVSVFEFAAAALASGVVH